MVEGAVWLVITKKLGVEPILDEISSKHVQNVGFITCFAKLGISATSIFR